MKLWSKTISALLMAAFAASAHAGTVPQYSVQTFLPAVGVSYSQLISSTGQMTGNISVGADTFFYITSCNSFNVVPPVNGVVYPGAINASGQIAGRNSATAGDGQVYFASGSTTSKLSLGGNSGILGALNDKGVVVGGAQTATGEMHAFYSTQGGPAQDLGTLGGTYSFASDVNEAGVAVGYAAVAGDLAHAAIYRNNSIIDIGADYYPYYRSTAAGINNSGAVAGNMQDNSAINGSIPFVWNSGKFTLLYGMSNAIGIDDAGTVLGYDTNGVVGAIWRDGKSYRLDEVLTSPNSWNILTVTDINGAGQIAAFGCSNTGTHACGAMILTPVPEPEIYAMLLAGLAICGLPGRRRKHAAA